MSGFTYGQLGNKEKQRKLTINNGDSEMTPFCWDKKTHCDWMKRSNNKT